MAYIERTPASRKHPRGGWKATVRGPDGKERSKTRATRADAQRWADTQSADIVRGAWVDPALGRVSFAEWLEEWRATTVNLRPSTRNLYEYLGRRYLVPSFGNAELSKISALNVRRWLASMRATKLSPNTVAKAYRLLARVLGAAVESGLIGRTPCVVKGAGTEQSPEMRFATVAQVAELADAVGPRYQALVLLAAYGGLRWGELAGLQRRRVNLLHATVTVAEQVNEINGRLEFGPPKTAAGVRTVALSRFLVDALERHLGDWAEPDPQGLVFPAPKAGPMRRSNFRRRVWVPATRQVGLEGLRFHDLRHSAATLAIAAGANTRELMERMGHASAAAALRYQHVMPGRDAAIAAALDELAGATAATSPVPPSAQVASIVN